MNDVFSYLATPSGFRGERQEEVGKSRRREKTEQRELLERRSGSGRLWSDRQWTVRTGGSSRVLSFRNWGCRECSAAATSKLRGRTSSHQRVTRFPRSRTGVFLHPWPWRLC